jgi:uncharacterized protein with PQ loop repeat
MLRLLALVVCADATEMSTEAMMEARLEMQMFREHTNRLNEFGVSVPAQVPPASNDFDRLHRWLRVLSFAFMLKAGAIASSVTMTLSPLRAVKSIQAAKDTLTYPPYCFVCVAVCGMQWCAYGTFAFTVTGNYGFLILVYSNVLGVIMGSYYGFTYYSNIKSSVRWDQFKTSVGAAASAYAFQAFLIATTSHAKALLVVGTSSAFMSVLVSVAPMADLPKILRTRDTSGMPADVCLASFIASCLWLGCAILLHDAWIFVPNLFGLVFGGFQLLLLAAFSASNSSLAAKKADKFEESYGAVDTASPDDEEVFHGCTGGTGGTGETADCDSDSFEPSTAQFKRYLRA